MPTAAAAPVVRRFRCWHTGNGDEVEITAPTADEAAETYAYDGEWGPILGAVWITVHTEDSETGEEEAVTIQIDQPEPPCREGDGHDWKDGPVFGNGGGVISTDTCRKCGMTRTFNSWATNPEDGTQGWEVTTYEKPAQDDRDWD